MTKLERDAILEALNAIDAGYILDYNDFKTMTEFESFYNELIEKREGM